VTPALLAGAGVGFGLLLLLSGLFPARPSLVVAAARLHRPSPVGRPSDTVTAGATESSQPRGRRLVQRIAQSLGLERFVERSVEADLRVVGGTLEDHVASRAMVALVGFALVPATTALMWAGGVRVSPAVPGLVSPLLGLAGFFVPAGTLRSAAAERRRSFRHAFSSFLDIVSVTLAGGAGVETALYRSAATGRGWAFAELRHALVTSQLLGQTPWSGLDRLGVDLGVVELQELAASVALAGEDGASVRASIAAKARALRIRALSDAESHAQAATERMSLPIVVLMTGFMVFVTYPSIARILTGL
jgi:Flp pilus assembly protein TadB